ncbi:Mitogen-activated protein kinase kinase 3-like protein, partial [Drosera capensis]
MSDPFRKPMGMKDLKKKARISIALEYMDGGSLADILRFHKPKPLSYILIMDDPSPSPPRDKLSPEFCSFIDICLQKDADARPTAEQGKDHVGPHDIFIALSDIGRTLAGDWPLERLVHVVEKMLCRPHGQGGVAIRVSGSFIIGNQFVICGDGVQVEGLPNFRDLSIDLPSKRVGAFKEQVIMEPGDSIGRYYV